MFEESLLGGTYVWEMNNFDSQKSRHAREIFEIVDFCAVLAMALALQKVHSLYRTTDASFTKAQAEFSTGVMSNQHVQKATASAASAAAKNAFSGGASSSNP